MGRRKKRKVTTSKCPSCNAVIDDAEGLTTSKGPSEGDVSICFYCAKVLLYGRDLTPRLPTDDEMDTVKASPQWASIQKTRCAIQMDSVERKTKRFGAGPN